MRKARGRRRAAYARAYLHHLVKAGETLGAMLLSEINIAYYQDLMRGIREAISQGAFASFASARAPIGRAATSRRAEIFLRNLLETQLHTSRLTECLVTKP